MKWNEKTVIITGSSKGIGRCLALRLGKEGARLLINGTDPTALEKTLKELLAQGIHAKAFPGDVSDPEICEKLVAFALGHFGKIDVLVNNAGICAKGFFEEYHRSVIERIIAVNLMGPLFMTKAALPCLKDSNGKILFISSLAGLRGMPNQSLYSLSKMALTSFAGSLRAELYEHGVKIGIAYIGVTRNDKNKKVLDATGAWRGLKERTQFFAISQEEVAKELVGALEKNRFTTYIGTGGVFYFLVSRYLPWLLDFFFRKRIGYLKREDADQ